MNKTILVIDDNTEIRENTAEILQLANYNVLKAPNGKVGVELALKHMPDLILCDIMMPELDGYGVLRAIKNKPELTAIPFVYVTAKSEKADFRHGMDLGADDFLTKPFSGDELLSIVAARLNKSEQLKIFQGRTPQATALIQNEDLSGSLLKLINGNMQVKKVKKRESLFIEGENSNFLYHVNSGKIKTYKTNETGKEFITNIYKPGDFFGFYTVMEPETHLETAESLEDSEVSLVSKQQFMEILQENPAVSIKLIQYLTSIIQDRNENLVKLAYNSARKRVAEAIVNISQKYCESKDQATSFPMNRNNISALSGISQESVSRNLTDFRNEGLIDIIEGTIKILDLKKLKALKN